MTFGIACGVASAQGPITNYCVLGAKQAAVSGIDSTNYLQGIIRGCTVTVFLTGTTTPATLFSNSSSTPLSNPFTANATTGQWLFYASTANLYDVVLSGGISPNTYPAPVTLTGLQPGGGGGGGGGSAAGPVGTIQTTDGSGNFTNSGVTLDVNLNLAPAAGRGISNNAAGAPVSTGTLATTFPPDSAATCGAFTFAAMQSPPASALIGTFDATHNAPILLSSFTTPVTNVFGITCIPKVGATDGSGYIAVGYFSGNELAILNYSGTGVVTSGALATGITSAWTQGDSYDPVARVLWVNQFNNGAMTPVDLTTPLSPVVGTAIPIVISGGASINTLISAPGNGFVYVSVGVDNAHQSQARIYAAAGGSPIGTVNLDHAPQRMLRRGNVTFTAEHDSQELQIVDFTVPAAPALIKTLALGCAAQEMTTDGNFLYISGDGGCMVKVNIDTPSTAFIVNTVTGLSGAFTALAVSTHYLFGATSTGVLNQDIGGFYMPIMRADEGYVRKLVADSLNAKSIRTDTLISTNPAMLGAGSTVGGVPAVVSASPLTNKALVVGTGGQNIASFAMGTNLMVLHGNFSGLPSWSSVNLMTDVTSVLPPGFGGTGVGNTATHTLGTSNQNWATLGTGIVKNTTTTGAISDAASTDVISLWTGSCTSSTFLRGDGSCATATGSTGISGGVANFVPLFGSATTITGPSHIDDGATTANTVTISETVNIINSVCPTCPGSASWGAGSGGSLPALLANSFGFAAPVTGGTSYLIKAPATITAGIAHFAAPATADGVNESALTSSAVNLASADVTGLLPVANGGTGTSTPGIVAGTNVTVTGTWPNQTVNATGGGSSAFSALTAGTNTTAAMVVGTGASLAVSGSGTIAATTTNAIAGNVTFSTGLSTTGAGTIASPYVVTTTGAGATTLASVAAGTAPTSSGTYNFANNPISSTSTAVFGSTLTALTIASSALSVSTNPLCPAGASGAFTTAGCVSALPICADTSASGTAQTCTTTPTFTVAANACIVYTTTTANTGAGLTLNVNSLGAKSVSKWMGSTTTLAANDVLAGKSTLACYDGTTWELSDIGNAPAGGTAAFSGITSGTNTTAAMVVGAGGSLNFTSTGTINASTLIGSTWASPSALGTVTPSQATFNKTGSGLAEIPVFLENKGSAANTEIDLPFQINNSSSALVNSGFIAVVETVATAGSDSSTFTISNRNAGASVIGLTQSGAGNGVFSGTITSALGNAPISSAIGGTGITGITCNDAACTVSRGSYTMTGGVTAGTGTVLTLVWPTTTTAWVCSVVQNGGASIFGLGHGVATATGMTITAGITVVSSTFTVDYNCVP